MEEGTGSREAGRLLGACGSGVEQYSLGNIGRLLGGNRERCPWWIKGAAE